VKQIRLLTAVVFLLASTASATVFLPASDRQLVDRSESVVVATVRDAASRVRSDGYVVTDYRLDVEQTLKGAATGTITISEIGGVSGSRVTFISDSAAYAPGERVMVFLKRRGDGTYFTTSMAMGKFTYTRNARGEAVVTREVSELRDDPARVADGFERFARGGASESYATKLTPIAVSFQPIPLANPPASAYCLTVGSPLRWPGGEFGTVTFFVDGTLPGVPNAASNIGSGMAAWTGDPNAGIALTGGGPKPSGASPTPAFDTFNGVYLNQTPPPNVGICDGSSVCTILSGNTDTTHPFGGETFVSIQDADIVVGSAAASQFEALITHEFGHAIGLRHADAGSPSSFTAIMTSSVNQGFGSNLQQWDRDAVETVYGNGPACISPTSASISGGGEVPSGGTATLTATVTGGNGTFTYAWFEGSPSDTSHPVGSNSPTFTTPPITSLKSYWVRVTNTCGSVNATTSVFPHEDTCTAPQITTQPASQTINSGTSAILNVFVLGSNPLTYQWYQAASTADTSHPVGLNNPLFNTGGLTQTTSYWVKITNACGTAISNVATITIAGTCTKPAFTTQPSSSIPVTGSQTFLIAFASGATSYQWFKGNAGDTSTPLAGSGPSNDRWINEIYIDLLGRPADAAALSTFGGLLGSGTSRIAVASSVLISTEYRQRLLTSFYSTFLHRAPSAAEISFWLPAFAASLTDEQIEAQIIGSPEYFAIAGGTNAGWITRVFNDVLGRTPIAAETSTYLSLLGGASRTTVALSILASPEAVLLRVQLYYPRFLRRNGTAADMTVFASAIIGGSTDEQVIAQIVAADEYFNFGTLLVTDPITTTTRYWVRATNACGTTDSTTAILTIPQCETFVLTQPQNATVTLGAPVTLSVLASGPGTLTYQWYRAQSGDPSNPIPGGTGPVLTFTPVQTGFTDFWVKVSSSCSSANSNTVHVTVNCGPRELTLSVPPTAPSATSYTVSWNGDAQLDTRYELQEATKADFSDAQTFTVTGATSRAFTHTATTDTRYYYRVHAAPICGGDFGTYSVTQSILVTAPQPSTLPNYNLARSPCTSNCTITQPIFIPGINSAGKDASAVGETFSVASDKPFMTVSPASGPLPAEGATVTVSIDTSQLDVGSTQGSIIINRLPAAGKIGALSDPPPPLNVPVSVSVVAPVSPKPKDTNAPLNTLLIPAIAHADGIGTRFVSDVRLTNTSNQPINYQLTYTPANTDGTQSGKQANLTVSAGDTKALNDIVKDWYGSGTLGEPGLGSLEIRPLNTAGKDTTPSVSFVSVAASRTYSVTSLGTFGQFIPALPLANFLAKSDVSKISLQQVSQSNASGGFRTNLGFVEGSGQPVNFVATLFDDGGTKLAERVYSLKPYESQQIKLDNFFNVNGVTLPNVADGRVEVKVTSDTGRVSAYASVLDNTTTDPLLVFPVDPSKIASSRFVVPGVAEFDSSFSNFHTDMRIYNGGTSAVDVTLAFTGASVPTKVRSIAAGQTLAIDNVLPTLWGITGGGSVVATTDSDAQLVVTARTFSRDKTNGGTFGQFIPGVTAADAVGNGDRTLQIVQLEESPAFRTNLGLVEVTGNGATVELLAFTPDSKVAAKATIPLAAGQYLQQGQIFKSLGFSNVYNGRITARVIGGTGRVAAYGSVIDNRTTDPTYVPSQ
jgi:hypothetical protein